MSIRHSDSDETPREFTLFCPPKVQHSFYQESDSNELEDCFLRESLHDIQLKDAISRQEIRKAERAKQNILNQIEQAKLEIQKLTIQLEKDDKLLVQQEKAMSNAEIAPIFSKISIESFDHLLGIIEKKRNWILETKERHEEELEYYRQVRFITNNINSTNPGNTEKLKELLIELTAIYEEHIQAKESAIRVDEAITNQDLAALNKQKEKLEKVLESIREMRIKDERLIFQLESKINSLEGDNTLTNEDHDDKTEENAIAAAEEIVNRLKQKLNKEEDLSPFVSKLSENVSKSKKRVIHLDLAQ